MNKKIGVQILLLFISAGFLFAHTPLLTVEDNGDGTIFVQGGFSNGSSAGGVKLYLTDIATGEKLYEGVFPDIGEVDLPIPNVPYTVTFDAGPGHVVVKNGPPPPNGFGSAAQSAASENTNAASEKMNEDKPSQSAAAGVDWTSADTAAVLPKYGVSYISLVTMIVSCVNAVLLLLLLRKRK